MTITGYLSEFSLAELFQFLEQGHKKGLLSISNIPDPHSGLSRSHYIWFSQGRILAAANRLDGKGLLDLISKRKMLSKHVAARLAKVCALKKPLGLSLKSQGVLQAEQLRLLFSVQVLRQVCALFTLADGFFTFDGKASLPMLEMTGISKPATEVTLVGLRVLRDWSNLKDKLPEPDSALISSIEGKPKISINQSEWQVWEFTNGTTSLATIAKQLRLPVETIQQIAFRLMVVGLVEEIPLAIAESAVDVSEVNSSQEFGSDAGEEKGVSQSFLQNLASFLQSQV